MNDPVTLLIATGLRRSELLALRWTDFDADAGTLTVAGKLVRATGDGLYRRGAVRTGGASGTPHRWGGNGDAGHELSEFGSDLIENLCRAGHYKLNHGGDRLFPRAGNGDDVPELAQGDGRLAGWVFDLQQVRHLSCGPVGHDVASQHR